MTQLHSGPLDSFASAWARLFPAHLSAPARPPERQRPVNVLASSICSSGPSSASNGSASSSRDSTSAAAAEPAVREVVSRQPAVPLPEEASAVRPVSRQRSPEDQARLERLFRDHHALIWRAVRRLGASAEVAADTTQQAYLIAAERLADLRPGCERAFLFSTAIGLARTLHRREQRCLLQSDMDVLPDPTYAAEAAARRHDGQLLLDRVLAKLEPELVVIFVLFELEGISSPEIAQMVGVPLGTVASRLRRARELFQTEAVRLEKRGGAA